MDHVQTAALRRAQDALRIAACESRRDYDLAGVLRALLGRRPQDAGLAWDIHQDLARGREIHTTNSIIVPAWALATRDLSVAGSAGYLVETDNNAAGIIELLRGRSAVVDMGATVLSGLHGDVTIPRESAEATGYWLATESTAISPTAQTLGQISLVPKSLAALTKYSRQLLLQSAPSVERFVKSSLTKTLAAALDAAALNGSGGAGEPSGLIGTSGVGSVTGTSLDTAKLYEFQTDVGNALSDRCGYVTTRAVAATLAARAALASGTERPLWTGNLHRGELGGYPAVTAPSVPASHLIFGHWPDLLIGEWGDGIEIAVNPHEGFTTGTIAVRAWLTCDVAVLRAPSFSLATAVT